MNYEDKALKSLLSGQEVEKKIMVSMHEETKKPQGNIESDLTEIMKEVRMPWFCPKCDHVMKKRLDDKMWRLFKHCFDCQIEEEHKLRISGEWKNYQREKYFENRKSQMLEQIQQLKDWKNEEVSYVEPVNVDTGFVQIDKFERPPQMIAEANDAIAILTESVEKIDDMLKDLNASK